jgi:RNA polymerase sigma-70 factor (ECF subfamily)
MNESDLIARAVTGNAAAFGLLVRQHQSRLRGFLRRVTRDNHALADDLAQETFLEAWRKIAQFRGQGSFVGWLLHIAWSRYLMTARQRKLEPLEENDVAQIAPDPNVRLDLESAMAKLSADERASLTLCYALGYSNDEGAEILAMPLGTLKSHIARGREKLRRLLEP